MSMLNAIESAVLGKLLEGDLPELERLRAQAARLHVTKRELTGVGFYTAFGHPADVVPLKAPRRMRFGDVLADIDGLAHGAGFVLFVDDGVMTMLEGYSTANEAWPDPIGSFSLRYWPPERDLSPFQPPVGVYNWQEVIEMNAMVEQRLQWSVRALAQPPEIQEKLFPDFACKTDELALDFDQWWKAFQECGATGRLTQEQAALMRELDQQIERMSEPEHESLWIDEALQGAPEWDRVRELARNLLVLLGWPLDPPPSGRGLYVATGASSNRLP
jgi:hypothetical protein